MVYKKIWMAFSLWFMIAQHAIANEHLLYAADLIRHGDRTPVHYVAELAYPWQEGLGELTAEGMQQAFHLGRALRKRYIEQEHLLPPHYHAETLYVKSSDENRTLMTTQAVLLGLYPFGTGPKLHNQSNALPNAYQPIPIHSVPEEMDNLLRAKPSHNSFLNLKLYIKNYSGKKAQIKALQQEMQRLKKETNLPLNDFNQLRHTADNLYVRQVHHIALPKGINPKAAMAIMALSEKAIAWHFNYEGELYPMGKEFLNNLAHTMQQVVAHKTALKYNLFSAHDSSIMSVMNALGIPIDKKPSYASDMNFALYQNNHRYYVKISFNNNLLNIPQCHGSLCSLAEFAHHAK